MTDWRVRAADAVRTAEGASPEDVVLAVVRELIPAMRAFAEEGARGELADPDFFWEGVENFFKLEGIEPAGGWQAPLWWPKDGHPWSPNGPPYWWPKGKPWPPENQS